MGEKPRRIKRKGLLHMHAGRNRYASSSRPRLSYNPSHPYHPSSHRARSSRRGVKELCTHVFFPPLSRVSKGRVEDVYRPDGHQRQPALPYHALPAIISFLLLLAVPVSTSSSSVTAVVTVRDTGTSPRPPSWTRCSRHEVSPVNTTMEQKKNPSLNFG